jgi:hypothetical protein
LVPSSPATTVESILIEIAEVGVPDWLHCLTHYRVRGVAFLRPICDRGRNQSTNMRTGLDAAGDAL